VGDAIPLEHASRSVVHRDGYRNRKRLLALLQTIDEVWVNRECVRDLPQLGPRDLEGVLAKERDGRVDGGHVSSFFRANGNIFGFGRAGGAYLIVKPTVRIVGGPVPVANATNLSW